MKGRGVRAEAREDGRQDREGADAVAVVVAEDDDPASAPGRSREPLHGLGEPGHRERVVQALRSRARESGAALAGSVKPRAARALATAARDPERVGEAAGGPVVLLAEPSPDGREAGRPDRHVAAGVSSHTPMARNFR